ncbi:CHAT domain-containing protein [Dactylosporangium salmoneum]|uniref:CHAT domain-containing protein n=1 Tax=Dactylosporangium salmoneum TaxID=53361 RepID=UPI003CD09209
MSTTPGPPEAVSAAPGLRVGRGSQLTLRASRTLVLLNACGSARLLGDDRLGEELTRSFAEIFLRRGARGVIATTGDVRKLVSAEFVQQLLMGTEQHDVSVPTALRAYRARLAADVKHGERDDARAEARLVAFFNGFMYLYFGNPHTLLRMIPKAAGE